MTELQEYYWKLWQQRTETDSVISDTSNDEIQCKKKKHNCTPYLQEPQGLYGTEVQKNYKENM